MRTMVGDQARYCIHIKGEKVGRGGKKEGLGEAAGGMEGQGVVEPPGDTEGGAVGAGGDQAVEGLRHVLRPGDTAFLRFA